ncbi:hypothetical protein CBL_11868 [Carabus blaptoides fortunei]
MCMVGDNAVFSHDDSGLVRCVDNATDDFVALGANSRTPFNSCSNAKSSSVNLNNNLNESGTPNKIWTTKQANRKHGRYVLVSQREINNARYERQREVIVESMVRCSGI